MAVVLGLRFEGIALIAMMTTACAQPVTTGEAGDAAAETETSVAAGDATPADAPLADARGADAAIDSTTDSGPPDGSGGALDERGDVNVLDATADGADGAENGDANEDAPDPYACPTMAYPLHAPCAVDGGQCSGPCDGCECGQSCTCYGGYWACAPNCCTTTAVTTSCALDSGGSG